MIQCRHLCYVKFVTLFHSWVITRPCWRSPSMPVLSHAHAAQWWCIVVMPLRIQLSNVDVIGDEDVIDGRRWKVAHGELIVSSWCWRKCWAVICISRKIPVTMIWSWYCPTLATMAESQQLLCLENDVLNFCNLCPFVVWCVHASFEHRKTWRHLGLPQSRMLTLMVQWDTQLKQACWLM